MINNVLVIGSVGSTAATVRLLVKHGLNVVGVLGYEPEDSSSVSSWYDLRALSRELGIEYKAFKRINEESNLDWARKRRPEVIFAVGFSQLLHSPWLEMPSVACVGFHPTCLPKGRGRAPVAWIILEERRGAATFFVMGSGPDDGPILAQHEFALAGHDDAKSVKQKILVSMEHALDSWLPRLKLGEWDPVPQDEVNASWYGKRAPEDGLIDWNSPATEINLLIKASSNPHPGAYTYVDRKKIVINSCSVETELAIKGVVGRILLSSESKGYLVQTGRGLLWIKDIVHDQSVRLNVGKKLGMVVENEIFEIWKRLENLGE